MNQPLTCQRDLFSIPPDHCWLNSAFMGPLSLPVQRAGQASLAKRAYPARLTPADFFVPADRVRGLCGELVNADRESIALITTTAAGTAIVANNVFPRAGQNVVMLADQFPSNVYPWRDWRDLGVEMRSVPAPDAPFARPSQGHSRAQGWNEALLDAIDQDTVLVAVEQAHWTDGTLFDLEAIGRRCKQVGAVYVIDATQTAGTMRLDVSTIQPDALIVHSYKAMLSNYGLGFMALSDRFAQGKPLEQSWLTRAGSEDFSSLVDYQDEFATGMRRYDSSLRATPFLIDMLEVACRQLLEWQPERVRQYLLGIEHGFVDRMKSAGFDIADSTERAANIFGIGLPPGMDSRQVSSELASQHIYVSVRGSAVRVSPHMYNNEADLTRLADALLALSQ